MKGLDKMLASLEQFGRLAEEFHAESDRGCAVLVLCILEKALHDVIRARVVDAEASIGRLAPRGGLDIAIDSAGMLGLLSSRQAKSFKSLVQVRNKFAHGVMEGLSFDTPDIANLIRSTEPAVAYPGDFDAALDNPSVRTRFLMLAGIVWMLLIMLEPHVERLKPAGDPDASQLPPGMIPTGSF